MVAALRPLTREGRRTRFEVVLVAWSQSTSLQEDAQSTLSSFKTVLSLNVPRVSRRILFLHWKALLLFKGGAPASLVSFRKHVSVAAVITPSDAYLGGRVQLFVKLAAFITSILVVVMLMQVRSTGSSGKAQSGGGDGTP